MPRRAGLHAVLDATRRSTARRSAAGSGAATAVWSPTSSIVSRTWRCRGGREALREVADAAMSAFEREEYDAAIGRLRDELDGGVPGLCLGRG
jgi:hypothetical protein